MDATTSALAVIGLVALAAALGVAWRVRSGRAAPVSSVEPITTTSLGLRPGRELGRSATLLQFSTAFCALCPGTHRMLSEIAGLRPDVAHVDIDVTRRPELVTRFSILQTPTVLVLDAHGVPRTRIGGAPARATIDAAIEQTVRRVHVERH